MSKDQIKAAHDDGPIELGVLTLSDIAAGDYEPFNLSGANLEKMCENHGLSHLAYLADTGFHDRWHKYKRGSLQNLLEWLGY